MTRRRLTRTLLASGLALVCGAAQAQGSGDPVAGYWKAQTSMGCHGIPSYTNVYPSYHVPILGGQHPEYIVAALKAYASGTRDHETMHAQASSLSEQDMKDIAAFFTQFGD